MRALVLGSVTLCLASAILRAAPPQPVTITTSIVFDPLPARGTFAATGPICSSGTFVDEFIGGGGNPFSVTGAVTVRKHFTCGDGTGTFTIQLHPQINPGNPVEFDESGPWAVKGNGGTGAYTNLSGYGVFGVVYRTTFPIGTETFTGFMSLD